MPGDAAPTKRQQVAADLERRVRSGEWAPGRPIASISESVAYYKARFPDGVSKNTVVDAYKDLVATGLVEAEAKSAHRVTGVNSEAVPVRVEDHEQRIVSLETSRDDHGQQLAEIRRHLGLDPA